MTNPTLDDRVREFLELAENVDHAPWTQTRGTARMSGGIHNCDGTILLIVYGDRSERELALGQFICAARNDAPAIIRDLQAEVERLREERDQALALVLKLQGHMNEGRKP